MAKREGSRRLGKTWAIVVSAAVFTWMPHLAPATEPAQDAVELSVEAQKECDQGRRARDRATRLAHFEKGEELAEQALELDDNLAGAHFALFCSLGEQIRIDGVTLSPLIFGLPRIRRALEALDRTLELNPDHLDALSSKGTFLLRLPELLGGDPEKGEQILKDVIQRDPKAVNARLSLARVYAQRGRHEDAVALATEALRFAESAQRDDLIPDAQATLGKVQAMNQASLSPTP